ncbi:Phage portal protein, SPP1 Gp6-like [Poriferisphaera corsica]|uniref:Phage portal protein, SPP1 Gp6-like n=1 Tax=Poriferisphaera corsica TaxID=2528020 RepID=A0A517YZA0_9BACT|nr:phage portal protein [Poriferisphaera corsica]QDU35519.1 Phage portal protein, SPP1 Gp6-like [Poriferisphaera corsica]
MAKDSENQSVAAGLGIVDLQSYIDEYQVEKLPFYRKLWGYYRNRYGDGNQKSGLPDRLLRRNDSGECKEIVIENDIAWRVHAMVDFMFSKPVTIQSLASDPQRANEIEAFLRDVIKANGGMGFYQNLALLGAIYGYVDVLVHADSGKRILLEVVEASRAVPVLNAHDYRKLNGYIIHWKQGTSNAGQCKKRLWRMIPLANKDRSDVTHTYVWTPEKCVYAKNSKNQKHSNVIESQINIIGEIPIVHIQNLTQPYYYEGLSEVEPLINLQDELNTRLSDRANRVTFQAFKMYLGKGIDGFIDRPVGPGQMWSTNNEGASIEEFGGDSHSPSEDAHIAEIREAMDKASGISPLVTGLVRDRIGNLTSENALRIVMMGLLAKTEKKRVNYGDGLIRMCRLILETAHVLGVFKTNSAERLVRIDWPEPMPTGETQSLINAERKLKIGVAQKQVLAELGYSEIDQIAAK